MKTDEPGYGLGGALLLVSVALAIPLALQGRNAEPPAGEREAPAALEAIREAQPEVEAPALAEEPATEPVEESAAEVDGLLELRVVAEGQPVPRARVRLYRQGEREPGEGALEWKLAATAATGDDGRLVLPARPGAYLMAVKAEGLAPVLRDVVRPEAEPSTRVELALEAGAWLSGRTATWAGEALPGSELVLTPYVRRPEGPWSQVEAPVEERVSGASDAEGRFHFDGLAPGLYRLEASTEGRRTERLVRVPGNVELELTPSGPREARAVDVRRKSGAAG